MKFCMPAVRTTRCPQCGGDFTRKTVRCHLRIGCTRLQREANRRKAVASQPQPPRRQHRPFRLRNHRRSPSPPRLQSPTPVNPHTHDRRPDHARPDTPPVRRPRVPALSDERGLSAGHSHPDFAFDTPGAGPSRPRDSPRRQPGGEEPAFRFYEDEWDAGVLLDSDSDDGRPDEPALYHNAPWLKGLAAADVLEQELEAEIARHRGKSLFLCIGLLANRRFTGRSLSRLDLQAIRGFNYKVDTDMSARAYDKLPRAFPEIHRLPKHHRLRTRIARLSGIKGVRIDCCVNSCMAFTEPFDILEACIHCGES